MHNIAAQCKLENRIAEYRVMCGLDQAGLAKLVKSSRQSVSRWENSQGHKNPKKFSFPTKAHCMNLLDVFSEKLGREVRMSDLFQTIDNRFTLR